MVRFRTRLLVIVLSALAATVTFAGGVVNAAGPLALFQVGQGWATFGLAVPAGAVPNGQGVTISGLQTQTEIKTRWPDGSMRFGVVTAQVPSGGSYSLVAGTPTAGTFAPTWPAVSVRFTIGGSAYTAALPAFTPANLWLDGPLVREARAVVVPKRDADGVGHPLLQVIYDIRSYAGGGHRVDVCVQNVRDVAEMDMVSADVSVIVAGSTVFSKAAVPHYSYTRWRKTFSTGFTESSVVPDFTPYYQANAFPKYLDQTSNSTYDTSTPAFEIMGFGRLEPSQPAPGGRPEIAPFPYWAAEYLVHKGASQRDMILKHGNLSGSWSHFITKADGVSLIRLDEVPDYWMDSRGEPGLKPKAPLVHDPVAGNDVFRGDRSFSGPRTDAEHLPNLEYTPYILTGDRFYLDQLKLWANNIVLKHWPAIGAQKGGFDVSRQGAKGILAWYWGGGSGGRGWAWPLREMVNAAVACPDNDPDKSYFLGIVRGNLDWAAVYNTGADTTGVTEATGWEGDTGHGDRLLVSLWQSAYLAWAIDWAERQNIPLGPAKDFRNRMIRSQINFLTHGANGYNPAYGAPYYPQVGRLVNGVPQLFTTWQQVWNANLTNIDWLPSVTQWPALPPVNGYYGPETRLLVAMGVREGLPGATTALQWVLNYRDSGGNSITDATASGRPGFGIEYTSTSTQSPPRPAQSVIIK